ncbi:nucleoside triphosphate pyrophosphohydrolase [Haliea sp. E17]|uniref:nucleoside triphosphate pyrophosphohydrolase n=1 Tax=Haliea sp. E17 TaxID=3401576 RepID=UPI003AAEA5C8
MNATGSKAYTVADLLRVMQRLRDPEYGCPWDLKQDFASIVPSTIEECYELAQAIEHQDYAHVAEELGDVLFQVVFYSQLGSERHLFDFNQVVSTLVEKLLRRHPHVFANGEIEGVVTDATSVEAVSASWESIKQVERSARELHSALADVPLALPALSRAQKLQKRAARTGFDWENVTGVLDKLDEEIAELREALANRDSQATEEELGDLLFSCVNLARHLRQDAETALRRSSEKFETRFRAMEAFADADGTQLDQLDSDALEALWVRAKES